MIADENGIQYDIRVGDYAEDCFGKIGYISKTTKSHFTVTYIDLETRDEFEVHYVYKQIQTDFNRLGKCDFITRHKAQKSKIEPIEIIPKYKTVRAKRLVIDKNFSYEDWGTEDWGTEDWETKLKEQKIEETTILDGIEEIPQIDIVSKINEIVSRLNELEV